MFPNPDEPVSVLICDDEPLERIALHRIFTRASTPIRLLQPAADGVEALQWVSESHPQIIFMDIRMPGMDGLEASRHILARYPETQIVILTAYSDFSYAQEALRLGTVDYVLKPAEPKALYEALERALVRIRSLRAEALSKQRIQEKLAEVMPSLPELGDDTSSVSKAVDYIRFHYQEGISLEQVAKAVSLSPAYFSRAFLRQTGTHFRSYLTWVRMEAAKVLLLDTSIPIADVAEKTGYKDSNHFSVRFKKETGVSPHLFRRQKGGIQS